jgi:hypothetical protein
MSIKSGASVTLLAAVLAFGACSSGNDGTGKGGSGGSTGSAGTSGGGTGGSTLPVVASCMAFCVAEKDCNDTSTVEDCYGYRCTAMTNMMPFAQQPESCRAAYKAYYDCLATQAQICDGNQANIPGACGTQASAIPDANCSAI